MKYPLIQNIGMLQHIYKKMFLLYVSGEDKLLQYTYSPPAQELVIRKPGINISTDFTIKLS